MEANKHSLEKFREKNIACEKYEPLEFQKKRKICLGSVCDPSILLSYLYPNRIVNWIKECRVHCDTIHDTN